MSLVSLTREIRTKVRKSNFSNKRLKSLGNKIQKDIQKMIRLIVLNFFEKLDFTRILFHLAVPETHFYKVSSFDFS